MFIIILKTKDVNYSKMKYINNRTKMKYKCNCGNKSKTTFANFKKVLRCNNCAGLERCTYKYVKTYDFEFWVYDRYNLKKTII